MDILNFITDIIDSWGYWSYLVMFLIALIESLVITGIFIPGTLIIIFLGFLSAQNGLGLAPLLIFVILGSITGDVLSFILGEKRGGWVLGLTRKVFKKDYLGFGREFFEKHGDKSVFIGRFVAILRPFIPFVAGVFKMNIRKFLLWDISSAILWATLYILLGYFSGAAWRTVVDWSGRAGIVFFVVAVIAVGSYLVKKHLRKEGIDMRKSSRDDHGAGKLD